MEMLVKQMNERISDLTTSLEFTQREVNDLKSSVKNYEKEKQDTKAMMSKLADEIESSNLKIKDLEARINYQEDYSKRNNVRISGVKERSGGETWEQTAATVTSLLKDKPQLPGLVLE